MVIVFLISFEITMGLLYPDIENIRDLFAQSVDASRWHLRDK